MPIKLLIFDLDGTLIDSLPDLANATNHMLEHFGYPRLSLAEVKKLVGQGARALVERALAGAPPDQVDQGLKLFLDYNLAHITDNTLPYPRVIETLQTLKERGIPLAVLSNKNVALCREVLNQLGLGEFFPTVMGADSHPSRKPSPEPVLALVQEFRLQPRECIMIGDSINDIAAGRDAGTYTIGCSYGYGDLSELADADAVVDNFPALLQTSLLRE